MGAAQWYCVCAALAAVASADTFAPSSYELESAVLINDVSRADKEVGYNIRAALHVAPLWGLQTDYLLQFRLVSPKLYLRGSHVLAEYMPHDSLWDSHSDTAFYAHWKDGIIQNTYLDPEEPPDILNYKKAIVSLFQFQSVGEYNETDVSGECAVLYETLSEHVFRKIKRRCAGDAGAVSGARRVSRYTLEEAGGALQSLYADEVVSLGPHALGLKARSWVRLARHAAAPAPRGDHADLTEALRALPAALRPLPLTLSQGPPDLLRDQLDDEELSRVLVALHEALESARDTWEQGGGAAAALAVRLARALRAAPRARLAALLQRADLHPQLTSLCSALGVAGTRAAHSALEQLTAWSARDPLVEPALAYLRGLALAPAPHEWVLRETLRAGESARSAVLSRAALLAVGAAARRAPPQVADEVRHALARSLARCQEDECRETRVLALGNMLREDTADLLLEQAARGGAVGVAALDALVALPARALTFARLDRVEVLALDERASLEVRAAALDLLVRRRAPVPAPLARVAHALYAHNTSDAHELRRVLWQRVAALAPTHHELRRLPRMLERTLRGWDSLAPAGTSSVLSRSLGWRAGGWAASLDSVQVARGGLLRRGAVYLRAEDGGGGELDALGVRVWARGLDALGGDAPADTPPEEAAAGLAFSVGGARLHDVTLFTGQAELLGHVWAGTASAPTPALRAVLPLSADRGAVPLAGGAVLHAASEAALSLSLDAQAQASLWYRSAHTELSLRAGAAAEVRAALRTAWSELSASAESRAAPRLRIGADLDFYSTVSLCVRARDEPHAQRRRVTLRSEGGARRLRVTRTRHLRLHAEGRTLALGRPNDVVCRTLRAADSEEAGP